MRIFLALTSIVFAFVVFVPASYAYEGEEEDVDDAINLLQDIADREVNEGVNDANDDEDLDDDEELDERDDCVCDEPNCDDPDCIDAAELEEIRKLGGPVKKFWRRRRYRYRRIGRRYRRIRFRFFRRFGK